MNRLRLVAILVTMCGALFMCSRKSEKTAEHSGVDISDWHVWPVKAKSFAPQIGQRGGSLVVTSFGSDPKTFNPITSNETSSMEVLQFVFEGLVSYDVVNQQPAPCLATSWSASADFLTYDFQLRTDVRWSDGTPFTADDVVFTFEAIFDKRNLSSGRDILQVNGKPIKVVKTGEHSVRMILPGPFGPFLRFLTGSTAPILPRHKLEQPQKAGKFSSTWEIDTKPDQIVGTGPFRIQSWAPSQQLVLSRNDHYWKRDAVGTSLPYLDRIVFVYVKDRSAELLKFRNGESDFFDMRGEDYPILKPLEQQLGFSIYNLGPPLMDINLIFNQNLGKNDRGKPYVDPVKVTWFRDQRFRQAVAFAINREDMVKLVHNGLAQVQHTPMGEGAGFFHNPNVRKYEHNLDSARALLSAAGFSWDKDGLLRDSRGTKVEFSLHTNAGNTDREKYCEMIRKDLQKIGITVHFSLLEFNNLVDKFDHSYDWEAIVLGITGSDDPHDGANVWVSSARMHQWYPRQSKPSTEWEARIDQIFLQGAQESDRVKRKALYDEWQQIYSEQLPYITLVAPHRFFAVRNKFGNINPVPLAEAAYFHKRKFFHNIEEIFVLPGRQ